MSTSTITVPVSTHRRFWAVAVAVVFVLGSVISSLNGADWDITVYTSVGEDSGSIRTYAEERLGEIYLRDSVGHDGRFFFVQANDPLVLDPVENASVLDRPIYRSQRMVYPLIAGAAGLFSPQVIVWSMVAVNIVAMAAGTWATAHIARRMGMSEWWGLSFVFNFGFISELNVSGAGIVAAAAAFGAVAAVLSGRDALAIWLLVLAALSREVMLIAAVGTAFWLWRFQGRKRSSVTFLALPVAAVATWALYIRWRIGWESVTAEVEEIGLPFVGFVDAFQDWLARSDYFALLVGVVVVILFGLFARRAIRSRHLVGWAFLGFVGVGILLTEQVWTNYYDISRGVAPILTAYVLLLFAPTSEDEIRVASSSPAVGIDGFC